MSDRVVIVGGGIVGACVASHLGPLDRPVVLLERDEPGAHTTASSAAQFTHHQGRPDRREYDRRELAREWYQDHDEAGGFSVQRLSTIHAAGDADDLAHLASVADDLAAFGATVRVHRDDLSAFGIDPAVACGGFELPDDGPLDQAAVVDYLLATARREGVVVDAGVEVTDIAVADGRVTGVETTAGRYEASTVVNAAGPWAARLNELAGVSVPLRHTAGPMALVEAPGLDRELPLTLLPDGYYLRHSAVHDDGLVVGSFATDYAGADRLGDDGLDSDADSAFDRDPDEAFLAAVPAVVERSLTAVDDATVLDHWLGHRTVTPDGRPVVDRSPVEGFVLACGMSGYGVTLAPAVGVLLATWLATGERPALLADLGHDRFGEADSTADDPEGATPDGPADAATDDAEVNR